MKDETSVILDSLGFHKGLLVETIVSTIDENGKPNAAPMGVWRGEDNILVLKIYRDTRTYRNIKVRRKFVINLTFNVELFYKTLFKVEGLEELFDYSRKMVVPPLKGVDCYIEAEMIKEEKVGERSTLYAQITNITIIRKRPNVFSRCLFLTIESLIHFTRIRAFLNEGKIEEARKLSELISHYYEIIRRNCRGGPYINILNDLINRIDEWGRDWRNRTS